MKNTPFYQYLIKFYKEHRDRLICLHYSVLKSLNSTTPSLLSLDGVKKILVLAPHPDDDAIGCGGTLLRLTKQGCYGETIFFTNGRKSETDEKKEITEIRRNEAFTGSNKLGIKKCHFLDYYDFRLKPDKNAVNFVLDQLNKLRPDFVFTPFFMDNHSDHKGTAQILALAASEYSGDFLCCCYEVWSTLTPNNIVDIAPFMEEKISAIESHKSQTAESSLVDLTKGLNRYRAITSGQPFQYAEAFFVIPKKNFIRISKKF